MSAVPNENVRPVFVAVAADEIMIVVLLKIDVIYAPVGMPVPLIACPTDKVLVLDTVTVRLVFVVAPVPSVGEEAVAFADKTIELVDTDEIVVPAEMPVPLIGMPA